MRLRRSRRILPAREHGRSDPSPSPGSAARIPNPGIGQSARYDGGVSARAVEEPEVPPRLPWVRRAGTRAFAEIRLTALAIWRGVTGIYHSNDLTFASSIAYYALLSLFPFFLLALSILASVTGNDVDRASVLNFVLKYFPRQFEFVNTQLKSMQAAGIRLGIFGSLL